MHLDYVHFFTKDYVFDLVNGTKIIQNKRKNRQMIRNIIKLVIVLTTSTPALDMTFFMQWTVQF